MKLGFRLRRISIALEELLRKAAHIWDFLLWLLFSPYKFSRVNRDIKNLLVLEIGGFGDVVNMVGIIHSFRQVYPQVKVYFVTKSGMIDFLRDNKDLEFISSDINEILNKYEIDAAVINGPVPSKFDLPKKIKNVVYVEGDSLSANLKARGFFNLRRKLLLYCHAIERRLVCFRLLGFNVPYKLSFQGSSQDIAKAKQLYNQLNPEKKKIVLINPGAGTIKKALEENKVPSHLWPLKNFSKLADLLQKDKCLVLINGMKEEEKFAKEIISKAKLKSNIKDICGIPTNEDLAFMKYCDLVISVDTGTVHLATISDVPVIDLMGPYPVELYAAWNPSSSIEESKAITIYHKEVCNGCRKYACPEKNPVCMNSISVEEVYQVAKKLLS